MYVIRQAKMAAALAALAVSGLGALLMGLCLYFTVRSFGPLASGVFELHLRFGE